VHRHNSKYGHKRILAKYCGVDSDTAILGEVQHSLFLSTHHFDSAGRIGPPRKCGKEGIPFFSWNSILPFSRQIPIGDPAAYLPNSPLVAHREVAPFPEPSRTLVMPKFNQELGLSRRLQDYAQLIDVACDSFDSASIVLAIHPSDESGYQAIRARADSRGIQLLERRRIESGSSISWELDNLFPGSNLVSDYPGAHVFRGQLCGRGFVSFFLPADAKEAYHPTMKTFLEDFSTASHKDRLEMSAHILGLSNRRSPEELKDILYGEHPDTFRTRIWIVAYKRRRSLLVQLRQSRFWGKSPAMRIFRRLIIRPHRERLLKGPRNAL
jgi:hypothetical protein